MMLLWASSWLLGCATLSPALDPALETAWGDWKGLHRKAYLEGEEASRRAVWEDNWRMIEQHNWEASQGKHTYRLGMNHFGDMTHEEFSQRTSCYLGKEARPATANVSYFEPPATGKAPKKVDWRKEGYVTPVKDQGGCGSCWAFSAVGALEGLFFKKHKELVALSEQNLLDCAWDAGNRGCEGGWPERAFLIVKEKGGLNSAKDYPYEAMDSVCRFEPENAIAKCSDFKSVKSGDEKALKRAVATVGPISVAMDASSNKLKFYQSGIFTCPWEHHNLNHAVLLVGYGEVKGKKGGEKGKKYWIVKNSWSEGWGDGGYLYLEQGSNQCGIASDASYPE